MKDVVVESRGSAHASLQETQSATARHSAQNDEQTVGHDDLVLAPVVDGRVEEDAQHLDQLEGNDAREHQTVLELVNREEGVDDCDVPERPCDFPDCRDQGRNSDGRSGEKGQIRQDLISDLLALKRFLLEVLDDDCHQDCGRKADRSVHTDQKRIHCDECDEDFFNLLCLFL